MTKSNRASFRSKLGVVLATVGSAVGLGNVWRFPYMTGQNGGAVFILIYVACVFLLGIPGIVSEFIVGRHAQSNIGRAFGLMGTAKAWRVVGMMGVFTGALISSYYCVVSGWCLEYIYASAAGSLSGGPEAVSAFFKGFSSNPWQPVVCLIAFLLATHFIIVRGVESGIERASKLMMPALFVILLILVGAACLLPGAVEGIKFLFAPDFTKLTKDVFLGALGQAFFSLSLGMGCLCTYASYFSRQTNLSRAAIEIGVIDTIVAILAGLIIFPAAFSVGINPDSGPSLVFITLPNVFSQAFAALPLVGTLVAMLFYLLLALAALTSLISLHEVSTAFIHEEFRLSRSRAALIVTVFCIVMGTLCSLSVAGYEGLTVLGMPLFDLFDFITGQLLMPIGGLFIFLFIGWAVPETTVHSEFTNDGSLSGRLYPLFRFCTRYVGPVAIMLIFLHQFGVI